MQELVSVIIPCYNAEMFIEKALLSIEAQNYEAIEIICINDGSKDHTMRKLTECKEKSEKKIIIIDGENEGVSSARNKGIEVATGKYLMFLDADDSYAPNMISSLVTAISTYNADIAYGTWTRDIKDLSNSAVNTEDFELQDFEKIMNCFMYKKKKVAFFNYIYRREIIVEHNIYFDTSLKYGEDNLFFWKYVCHCNCGVFYNAPLYRYYDNPKSAVHSMSWRHTDAVLAVEKAYGYYILEDHPYKNMLKDYLIPRTKIAVAKNFAIYKDAEDFYRFVSEYSVKKDVLSLFFKNGIAVSLAALGMSISPFFFYNFFSMVRQQ